MRYESKPPPAANRSEFTIGTAVFLRLLALVHLVAFVSFWVQLEGLVGASGLLPANDYFAAVHKRYGDSAYFQLPSLCWIFGAGKFLHVLCGAGVILSGLLFAGIAPAICLVLLWLGYLSLSCAGQIFFNFQWDALLLETTLLAIFVAPWSRRPGSRHIEPPRFARLLLWWLLFRLMFFAGVVKLASGDPLWRDLTALNVHFETQPLPTVLGWYAHQLPVWWHRAECAGMFAIELVVPFFIFAPRMLRHNAALLLAGMMLAVALTGNYTFFNFLAIALCLACFDDAWWRNILPQKIRPALSPDPNAPRARVPIWRQVIVTSFAVLVFSYTLAQSLPVLVPWLGLPPGYRIAARLLAPFRSLNNYGLFAIMTNPRPELIFEGSSDGRDWRAYEFPHKPGELKRRPTWVAPHQPRLDWQLWFAALGEPVQNRWVYSLCEHLLRGTPEVLALLRHNPFPNGPPRHLRVVRYEYHFTDRATRARTGQWWRRTPIDFYIPSARLQ